MKAYQILLLLFISQVSLSTLSLNFTIGDKAPVSFIEGVAQMQIDYSSQTPTALLCMGSTRQCFEVQINLSNHFTWVADSANPQKLKEKFDMSKSSTCNKLESMEVLLSNNNIIKGFIIEDTIWIGEVSIPKAKFVSVTDSISFKDIEGMIGLGYSPDKNDQQYNIRSQLINHNVIKENVFEIEFTNRRAGTIIFGGISDKIVKDYKHYGNCPIVVGSQKESSWSCSLRSMSFGEQYSKDSLLLQFENGEVKFDLSSGKTLFPMNYLLRLEKLYFKNAIENGDCNFGIKNEYYTYTCLTDKLPDFQQFSLVFDEWAIHIPYDDLFVYDDVDKEYEFVIYNKDGYDGFVIGTNIMKHFNMVFDQERQMVGFYNSNNAYTRRISDEPIRPPKVPTIDINPPIINPDKKPLQPLQPGNEENPFKPPFIKPDGDNSNIDRPIPVPQQKSFFVRFLMSTGVISLIFAALFGIWLGFRYMRRKKYSDPSFYYKATDDLFAEGTRIE